nr:hypothetical protein GCM10020185_04900 [Pseudomonas brassicacearum subsp. brassicacearum]
MSLELQIGGFGCAAEALVLLPQPAYLHALLAQGIKVAVEFAQQAIGRSSAAIVRPLPFIAQADGFANGALEDLGLATFVLQLFLMWPSTVRKADAIVELTAPPITSDNASLLAIVYPLFQSESHQTMSENGMARISAAEKNSARWLDA